MPGKQATTNVIWPKIGDIEAAKQVAKSGFWAAAIVAVVTAIFATIALVTQKEVATIDAWAYVDAVLFALIAWRVKKFSRVFAVAGIVLDVLEEILLAQQLGGTGVVMAIILLLMFIHGARGVFAYHRFVAKAVEAAPAP